jgi:putative ABC transport system permease protein
MRAIDIKLLRDLRRLWAQALAIALVMASGVATLVLANGAYRSLEESRSAYYERNRFADVFAAATRAPLSISDRISAIPGVAAAEPRIVKFALLDVAGLAEPATGLAISIPDLRAARLNVPYLREGRLPETGRTDEIVVNEQFARANGLGLASRFKAILNGRLRELSIVGIALSPEFIYAIGPGDLMPDDQRFCVMWMSYKALAGLFDLDGAFNNVALSLLPGADESEVMRQADALLARYGGTGAYGRKDQLSHSFIDAELKQLAALARVMPPIFLSVAAFLINITLSRLVALEREQIGLLKAVGYEPSTIAWHYIKLVLLIAAVGIAIGFGTGATLGRGLTRLYANFFHFPVLVFSNDPDVYALAALVSAAAAILGAFKAVREVLELTPAVAMQPPAPPRYRRILPRLLPERLTLFRPVSQSTVMAFRQMLRRPLRAGLTMLGLALGVALLVTALMSFDAVEEMVEIAFHHTDRQDATINFADAVSSRAVEAVGHLPGVLRVEPYRSASVRLTNGPRSRRLTIIGKPVGIDLSRVLDINLRPVRLPETGLMLGTRVAQLLASKSGDLVDVEVLEGRRYTTRVPVTGIIESYFGLVVFMDIEALNSLLGEGRRVNGTYIRYDGAQSASLFREIKRTPMIESLGLQRRALKRFRETIALNINYMVFVYVSLAVIIAFGIVYNSARIQLSERARELASLRVLGFTRSEVSRVLLTELAILSVVSLPIGWLMGYGFGWLLIQSYSSDLYRAPFVITTPTFAKAALVVLAAATASALIVRRRIDRLDLVAVLKTRE